MSASPPINVTQTPSAGLRLQSYKKKCTFANIPEEKLQFIAFFSIVAPHGLARMWCYNTKKETRSVIFLRESTA